MPLLSIVGLSLILGALLWAGLLTVQAYEHRRYSRVALNGRAYQWHAPPEVLVCVPCKGVDLELDKNLAAILTQDYSNYRVRFVVESQSDPACPVIRRQMAQANVPCELIDAGPCSDSGQKVHNLLQATRELPARCEVLAFFDSDARPAPSAIARMVDCVCRAKFTVATGYRWFVPRRPRLATLALASINAAVAGLMKRSGWNMIWGGAWALSRDLFEQAKLADAWRGTLSDDLVASRVLRCAGARLVFEPGCMCVSMIDVGWSQAVEFLRRQFVIGRCYAPAWWWMTLPILLLQPLVLFGGPFVALALYQRGTSGWYMPVVTSVVLLALSWLRSFWRQSSWRAWLDAPHKALHHAARFDLWAAPLGCLFAVLTMLMSLGGRSITWRGIYYHIGPGGRITLLGRTLTAEQQQAMLARQAKRNERERLAALRVAEARLRDASANIRSDCCASDASINRSVA